MMPPPSYMDNPTNAVTTRFVKTATNKMRCPIFTLAWTPEGRRLVTGASSGEFTLWNGLTFNFETILQVRQRHSILHSWWLVENLNFLGLNTPIICSDPILKMMTKYLCNSPTCKPNSVIFR